jgi:hypothetical protein
MHPKHRLLIRPRFKLQPVKGVHVAVVLCSLLNKFCPRAVNGIASASSVTIAPKLWIQSMLLMDQTRKSIAEHVTAKSGDHMVMDLLVVQVSCKPME